MPIGASYGGGFLPSSVTGMGLPNKDNVLKGGGMGIPQVDPAGGLYGGVANTGGINPGGGLSVLNGGLSRVGGGGVGGPNLPPDFNMPTPMGGLPPGIPPIQGPGSLLGTPPVSAPAPSPMGGLPGGAGPYGGIMGGQDVKRGRMNSTQPPPMRNGGVGGVAPRPAQGPMMRGIRGRGGMSMF